MWWYCFLFIGIGIIIGLIVGSIVGDSRRGFLRDMTVGGFGAFVGGLVFAMIADIHAVLVGAVGAVASAIILMLIVKLMECMRKTLK